MPFSHLSIYRSFPEIFAISLKLSEIAPRSAPANFKGAGPQKFVPKFSSDLVTHHVNKLGEFIPTGHKGIFVHMLNFAPMFEFFLPLIFSGAPNFWM